LFDCLEHGKQPIVGAAEALAAFEIAHAATQSWQLGRPVTLAEVRGAAHV